MSQLIKSIEPSVIELFGLIITGIIGIVGIKVSQYFSSAKIALEKKIGAATYDNVYKFAENTFKGIDETFRILPKVENIISIKQEEFFKQMQAKFPDLTTEQIEHFRQAIAGEINKDKTEIEKAAAPDASTPTTQNTVTANQSGAGSNVQ